MNALYSQDVNYLVFKKKEDCFNNKTSVELNNEREMLVMKTSYFAKYRGEQGVCISLYPPKFFKGKHYKELAPTPLLLKQYKEGQIDEQEYEQIYRQTVLAKLDAQIVYDELKDTVLLCFERSDTFCHRQIVAKWIKEELNIVVEEI